MSIPKPKPFQPLLPTESKRPTSRFFGPASTHNILRDQLPITTWLLLGALAQTPLYFLLGRLAFLPAFILLTYRLLDAYAQATGWKRNTYMNDTIQQKFSAQFPNEDGVHGPQPSNTGVVVLLIGTRSNHPYGLFAPGFKETGDYFVQMARDLDAHADDFGFLGMSAYQNVNDRTSSSELLSVAYFRTTAGLHAFAHSSYHREGWDWWNRNVKKHPHISIFHEIFEAPRGHWESIYVNTHVSGVNATAHKVLDEEGREQWAYPVVDASKGLLKTSAGRMARSGGLEHEGYEFHDVYERYGEKA